MKMRNDEGRWIPVHFTRRAERLAFMIVLFAAAMFGLFWPYVLVAR